MGVIPALDTRVKRLTQITGSMPRLEPFQGLRVSTALHDRHPALRGRAAELVEAGASRAACWLANSDIEVPA